MRRSLREVRGLIDEVADVNWRHPAWWLLAGATSLVESSPRFLRAEDRYLSTDGSERSDTFMARAARREDDTPAERIALAIARARAGVEAIARVDGTLPEQPLACYLASVGTYLERRALGAGPAPVAFDTPIGPLRALLFDDPASDVELASALAKALAGRRFLPDGRLQPIDLAASEPTESILCVSLMDQPLATARHLHRRVWTDGGGPWLGLGEAPGHDIVSTSHLAIDGYGHAVLSDTVFRRLSYRASQRKALVEAARFGLSSTTPIFGTADPDPDARPLGIATAVSDELPSFPAMAYALGITLERIYRAHESDRARRRARFTPTFQVPVAPGERDDPNRRRRRVIPGLMSVKMTSGSFEPFAAFRSRVPKLLEREISASGPLTRLLVAAREMPLPTGLKRRLVASSGRASGLLPPVEVLSGRGCLSLIRFADADLPRDPLFAVSAPALDASSRESLGGNVLTCAESQNGVALTVSGTGLAGTTIGAQAVLDTWLEALAEVIPLDVDLDRTSFGSR
jgi:hypothetical protein